MACASSMSVYSLLAGVGLFGMPCHLVSFSRFKRMLSCPLLIVTVKMHACRGWLKNVRSPPPMRWRCQTTAHGISAWWTRYILDHFVLRRHRVSSVALQLSANRQKARQHLPHKEISNCSMQISRHCPQLPSFC